ncbi:hypothetical protein Tco_0532218 [Tanacetum coccineum]
MAQVNFKPINKLAKEGLVDGLPLKVFTNEHNFVACNKGKQHKASYKHISASNSKIRSQAEAEIRNQGVSADRDPAGIGSAGGVSAGSTSAGSDPAGSHPAGSDPAGQVRTCWYFDSCCSGYPSCQTSVLLTSFPVPSKVCKDQSHLQFFTSSSYDDDFRATLTNLAPAVEVNPVPTKRVNTIHPQSQILVFLLLHDKTDKRRALNYDGICTSGQNKAIRQFLAFASYKGFWYNQLDVKRPFLYGKLQERSYFTPPKGFDILTFPKQVYRAGLKLCMDFISTSSLNVKTVCFSVTTQIIEAVLFDKNNVHQERPPGYTFGGAWCDELSVDERVNIEMSDMGRDDFLLKVLQVKHLPDGYFISQDKPSYLHTDFSSESVRNFQVSKRAKPKLGLLYPNDSPFQLESLQYSDYAGYLHGDLTGYPTTGGCQFLGRRLISWQCKKQTIVATSSTEAEYVALASCLFTGLWIHNHLLDLVIQLMNTKNFIDNQRHHNHVVNTLLKGDILPADKYLVSAGRTKFCWTFGLLLSYYDSAGSYSFLLDALFPAVSTVELNSICSLNNIHAAGVVYAANTSIHAAGLGCAASIMFLLADLFLLVVTCFCCAQLDIAGWLVSATSHLVSAGSLHSCWCNNVSAA